MDKALKHRVYKVMEHQVITYNNVEEEGYMKYFMLECFNTETGEQGICLYVVGPCKKAALDCIKPPYEVNNIFELSEEQYKEGIEVMSTMSEKGTNPQPEVVKVAKSTLEEVITKGQVIDIIQNLKGNCDHRFYDEALTDVQSEVLALEAKEK